MVASTNLAISYHFV